MADMSDIDPTLLQEFLSESQEMLDGIDPLFVQLEAHPDDLGIIDGVFRPVHSVKGNSGFFGLDNIKSFAHIMENILQEIRSRKRAATPAIIDVLLKGVDFLRAMLDRLAGGDFSTDFSPEEQAHLDLLNRVSAEGGDGAAAADPAAGGADDGPAPLVASLKEAYDEFKASADHESMMRVEAAVSALVSRYLAPPETKAAPADDGARLLMGEVDVTAAMRDVGLFLDEVTANERDEGVCEGFRKDVAALREAAVAAGKNEAVEILDTLLDEFETLHNSGIGIDDLMGGLLRERHAALYRHLDRLEAGEAVVKAFRLNDRDVTRPMLVLEEFLADVKTAENDEPRRAAFLSALDEVAAADPDDARGVRALAATIRDEFTTIHEARIGFDDLIQGLLKERLEAIFGKLAQDVEAKPEPEETGEGVEAPPPPPVKEAPAEKPAAKAAPRQEAPKQEHKSEGKTIRIAEEKVDHFMSFVGELIITGEVFSYIQKKMDSIPDARKVSQEFKNANLSFNDLSSQLQKSLMEVRRVPLKSMMQKLPRIVRDTTTQLGKHVDLHMAGEDVQIDKSILEGLDSPLVHMIRNSVDHGVEMPDDRVAAGKDPKGNVWITASATEEQFSLTIKDDGKGLDLEAIKAKAVSRGVMTEEAARAMPDKEAYRLIFNAGLSTAKVVTDVSGRGVGMDVVLSNITRMNGNILVDSEKGKGSTFTILLPMTVTLAVIDGLVARIGDEQYIIPLVDVRESVRPGANQIHTIRDTTEVLDMRGQLYPVVHLNDLLGTRGNTFTNPCDATVVVVQGKKNARAALMVDELIGQQSVVVKDLGKQFEDIPSIRGGAILGDGRVGLVLNIDGILNMTGALEEDA